LTDLAHSGLLAEQVNETPALTDVARNCSEDHHPVFVDSIFLHRWWSCHRLPERSFSVAGRQFHICARCTGVVVGLVASPFLIPLHQISGPAFFPLAGILCADALTQLCGFRKLTNVLRFSTGFLTTAYAPFRVDLNRRALPLMAQFKTLRFFNTARGQHEKIRQLTFESSQGWRVIGETIEQGGFRGGKAFCLFEICPPLAFFAGRHA
jgi:uncharacterized membrane protein